MLSMLRTFWLVIISGSTQMLQDLVFLKRCQELAIIFRTIKSIWHRRTETENGERKNTAGSAIEKKIK